MLKGVSVSVFGESDAPQVNNDEEEQQKHDKAAISFEDLESKLLEMPERKHVDALLDVSEQSFMRDLEPHEWHCYPGWEHAVHGWDRVSPLCCVMMNQTGQDIAKHKEAESLATSGFNRTPPKVGSTASLTEQHCKPKVGSTASLTEQHCKPKVGSTASLTEQHCKPKVGSTASLTEQHCKPKVGSTASLTEQHCKPKVGSTASLTEQHGKPNAGQPNVKEAASLSHQPAPQDQATSPHHSATQKSVPGSPEKKWVARETSPVLRHASQSSPSESRALKVQKHTVRHDVTMVPIKNFKFLPPINSPQKDNKGKKTADAKNLHRLEKGIKATRTGLNATANLERPISSPASNDSHQQSLNLFPNGCVSVRSRRKSSKSSKMDTLHPMEYPLGKNMPRAMIQPLVPAKSLLI